MIATGSTAAMIADSVDAAAPHGGRASGGVGYAFAKSSIVILVRQLSLLFAPDGIRVNAVHPTNVATDLLLNEAMFRQFRPDLENPTRQDAELAFPARQALPILTSSRPTSPTPSYSSPRTRRGTSPASRCGSTPEAPSRWSRISSDLAEARPPGAARSGPPCPWHGRTRRADLMY